MSQTAELVKDLRAEAATLDECCGAGSPVSKVMTSAADRIEALEAALRSVAEDLRHHVKEYDKRGWWDGYGDILGINSLEKADALLSAVLNASATTDTRPLAASTPQSHPGDGCGIDVRGSRRINGSGSVSEGGE